MPTAILGMLLATSAATTIDKTDGMSDTLSVRSHELAARGGAHERITRDRWGMGFSEKIRRVTPSTHFEDRTGWTPHDVGMQAIRVKLGRFNPLTAGRGFRAMAVDAGILDPIESPFLKGLPRKGMQ